MLIPSMTRALAISTIDIALLTECGSLQSPVRYKHCTPAGVRRIGWFLNAQKIARKTRFQELATRGHKGCTE
jgi:hypothetical protein